MKIEITHSWNGQAAVKIGENEVLSPSSIGVQSWPAINLIQVGNGIKFLPEQQLPRAGDSYTFSFGDYDVVIIKRRTGGHIDPKIVSLALARQKKEISHLPD